MRGGVLQTTPAPMGGVCGGGRMRLFLIHRGSEPPVTVALTVTVPLSARMCLIWRELLFECG